MNNSLYTDKIALKYPDLFNHSYHYDKDTDSVLCELTFKDKSISEKIDHDKLTIYNFDASHVWLKTTNYHTEVTMRLWLNQPSGYFHMTHDLGISDQSAIQLFEYGLLVGYLDNYGETVLYDSESIIRRRTIKNIIND